MAINRLGELEKLLKMLEDKLKTAPPGNIRIKMCNGSIQYYLRTAQSKKSGQYIRKNEVDIISPYLQKRYYEDVVKVIKEEIGLLRPIKKYCETNSIFSPIINESLKNDKFCKAILYSNEIQNIYSNYPKEIKKYIKPIFISDEEFIEKWISAPYAKKTIPEDVATFITDNGERVRSKSELNIANALYKHGIPYKYECPLTLKTGITIHPDFTILKMPERKEIYWEHRGMMDDIGYARQAVQRIQDYLNSGYCIGKDIIISEETSKTPLGTREIDAIIDAYFRLI